MTHLLRLDAVAHRDEFAVRLGHVVRDPRALTEIWTWWADGGGVPQQHEDSREMAVYRLLVGYGLDFSTARSLVQRGAVLVAA